MYKVYLLILVFFSCISHNFNNDNGLLTQNQFKLGNQVLIDKYLENFKDKRIAVLTNQTGILADGTHIIDALLSKNINIIRVFSPEHGIRGDENYTGQDEKTGIPIISLYGGKYKPSTEDLSDIDILIYDIQDVGARFYTYTSTLYYAVDAVIENNKQLYICDRPVIINPGYIDGFMLQPDFESFVGKIPAPVCYGMTCGELALMLAAGNEKVSVIKMEGYSHSTDFDLLDLAWVKPSPNMFTIKTAVCYPAACFLEGTNVSEGRGTEKPFEYFGAPWIDAGILAEELNTYQLEGVKFEPVTFTPSEKISAYPPKYFNKQCSGIYINVMDKFKFEAMKCGVAILVTLHKLFDEFRFNKDNFIDKLAGTDKLRKMIMNNSDYYSIINSWKDGVTLFTDKRSKYLLY